MEAAREGGPIVFASYRLRKIIIPAVSSQLRGALSEVRIPIPQSVRDLLDKARVAREEARKLRNERLREIAAADEGDLEFDDGD